MTWGDIAHILAIIVPLGGLIGWLDSRARNYRRFVYERLRAHDDEVKNNHSDNVKHINRLDVRLARLESRFEANDRRAVPR